MEIELLSFTQNPLKLIYTACRTCYSKLCPSDIYKKAVSEEKQLELVNKVLGSGHTSVSEHVYFSFAINGISRACSHQLVRHRIGIAFSQQSQRYVEIKEDINNLQNLRAFPVSNKEVSMEIANKYFVDVNEDNYLYFIDCLHEYVRQISTGIKPEDARQVLPNATKTNIVLSCNLREFIHICNLRLCKHAQLEIRTMVQKMREEILKHEEYKFLAKYLVPNCKQCTDFRDCKEVK